MIKFIRKYEKNLLAIFGVFLMISFVATMGPSSCDTRSISSIVDGRVDGQKVTRGQILQAKDEFQYLGQRVVVRSQNPAMGEWMPIVLAFFPPTFERQMSDTPALYYLLQLEAERMGVAPNFAAADEILANDIVAITLADGRRVPFDKADEPSKNDIRMSLARMMMVQSAFRLAANVIKVSEPIINHDLASRTQQIKSRVVDFPVKDYQAAVPEPTTEQLQQLFDRYGDTAPQPVFTESNPFGFGYKYPNRVKLQYISVPGAEARKAIRALKDEYLWKVEAQQYYIQHQSEFPTTQPAASEALTLGPTTASAKPTTMPFDKAQEQIMDRIIEPMVDKLQGQIQTDLADRMRLDYDNWKKTTAASPTTAPGGTASTPAFDSFEYLKHLADLYQTKYRVTLTIASLSDSFKSADDLSKLPGIGQINGFGQAATSYVDAFVPADQKNTSGVLALFQPSRPIADTSRDIYVFRVTAADPAHKPKSLDEVHEQLVKDWKAQKAIDLAKADADKLLQSAMDKALDEAAEGKKVITTGFYPLDSGYPIEDYKLSARAQAPFVRGTYEMLGTLTKADHRRPTTMIAMPADEKIAVAEVIAVNSQIDEQMMGFIKPQLIEQVMQQDRSAISSAWFDYQSVVDRLGYTDESGRAKPKQAAAQ